jgi:hypothetical protein
MFDYRRVGRCALAAIVATLLAPAALPAPPAVDRDTHEVNNFVLTEAAFNRFAQATKALEAATAHSTAACADDDDANNSIDVQTARLDKVPGASAAVHSAGLTTREYVVITWSLVQSGLAAWSLSKPGGRLPPGVSMANVDFYRAHAPAIEALRLTARSGGCGDSDDDGR